MLQLGNHEVMAALRRLCKKLKFALYNSLRSRCQFFGYVVFSLMFAHASSKFFPSLVPAMQAISAMPQQLFSFFHA